MSSAAVEQIRQLTQRLEKAQKLVDQGKVHPILNLDGCYFVESNSRQGSGWMVNGECACEDSQNRQDLHHGYCFHRLAVELFKDNPVPAAHDSKPKSRRGKKVDDLETPAKQTIEQQLAELGV